MIPYSMDYMRRQLRVCIYARVSTEHEAQISGPTVSTTRVASMTRMAT